MSVKLNIDLNGGITLVGISFVILKLCGVINWSWWLVTMPFWGGLVVLVFFILVLAIKRRLT